MAREDYDTEKYYKIGGRLHKRKYNEITMEDGFWAHEQAEFDAYAREQRRQSPEYKAELERAYNEQALRRAEEEHRRKEQMKSDILRAENEKRSYFNTQNNEKTLNDKETESKALAFTLLQKLVRLYLLDFFIIHYDYHSLKFLWPVWYEPFFESKQKEGNRGLVDDYYIKIWVPINPFNPYGGEVKEVTFGEREDNLFKDGKIDYMEMFEWYVRTRNETPTKHMETLMAMDLKPNLHSTEVWSQQQMCVFPYLDQIFQARTAHYVNYKQKLR